MPVFFRKKSIVIKEKLCYFLKKFGMRTLRCTAHRVRAISKEAFSIYFWNNVPKARRITWLVLTAPFSPLLLVFLVSWPSLASWLPRFISKPNERPALWVGLFMRLSRSLLWRFRLFFFNPKSPEWQPAPSMIGKPKGFPHENTPHLRLASRAYALRAQT